MRSFTAAVIALLAMLLPASAEMRLIMVEQPGCIYCARWDTEVGDAYALTEEGRAAPLMRIQLRDPPPQGVSLTSRPMLTPTFILVSDGAEVGRIEGYPGEHFFWPLLGRLLAQAQH